MLRDPLAVQKILADHLWPKNICKTRKTPLEPLDLLATVGQSCVCESVNVLVSVCVCVRGDEQRCGVATLKSPKKTHIRKKHISLCLHIYISNLSLYLQ